MLDLSPEQLALIRAILAARLPQREVRAFGSRVDGRAKPHSDLDLVVMGEEPVADSVLAELNADLDDSDLPFRVDVVLWREAPSSLREAIAQRSTPIQT
ncbi:MAG: nucleotidyltransferase domain-containing protein [Thiobacillaceae bacterium]|nr:nucleotidyltransferase domain-containing protein [Thiobacillaceae bacterium]MCX7672539.1 nucleotidyltransferase domain-containing protein [Thiobacillaceae bacterium]